MIFTFMRSNEFEAFMNNTYISNDRYGSKTIYDKLFKKLNVSGLVLCGFSKIPEYVCNSKDLCYYGINKDDAILLILEETNTVNRHNYDIWIDCLKYEKYVKNNSGQHYRRLESLLEKCVNESLEGCSDTYQVIHKSSYTDVVRVVDLKGLTEEMRDLMIKTVLDSYRITH